MKGECILSFFCKNRPKFGLLLGNCVFSQDFAYQPVFEASSCRMLSRVRMFARGRIFALSNLSHINDVSLFSLFRNNKPWLNQG